MDRVNKDAASRPLNALPHLREPASKSASLPPLVLIGMLLVLIADVWFISFGTWSRWPAHPRADYYDQLASAFAHGSLALEQTVDQAVLALARPYSPSGRHGVPIPLDFTLFDGKYYLYFGPVPALPLTLLKLLGAGRIGDQYLVFCFIAGIVVVQALLLVEIRRRFFPKIPDWLLGASVLFCGLVSPFAWILTEARVYEASLTGGQFFFLAGCYFVLISLRRESARPAWLLLAGAAWGLSIGCRLTLAVPVGLLCLLIGFGLSRIHSPGGSSSNSIRSLLALAAPLVIAFGLLGWYNLERFGSVLETGFQYQLGGTNFQRHRQIFSTLYILPNAFNYLVALPHISPHFPFLQPVRGHGELRFAFEKLPYIYHTRAMTGVLASVPFSIFAAISVLSLMPLKKLGGRAPQQTADSPALMWIMLGLGLAGLSGLGVILSYFWVEARFLIDFSPSLMLLSVLGFFLGYQAVDGRPLLRGIYLAGALALMIVSILASNLLAYSMHSSYFQQTNPALWNWLTSLAAR